jgi:adhesin transport system membrane fusion protein
MLNISKNSISHKIDQRNYKSFQMIQRSRWTKLFLKTLLILLGFAILFMFVPWTQNLSTKGFVTTMRPDHRPQTIPAIIAGRVEKWYVQEGDLVKKGDTIIFISEIKPEYFDTSLVSRTRQQALNKGASVESYEGKIDALDKQLQVYNQMRVLKLEQGKNKLQQSKLKYTSDSIDYQAAQIQYEIANKQFERIQELYKQGLKSLTDLEQRKLKVQESLAKVISQENKVLSSKNDVLNAKMELANIENEYREKVNKTSSDQFSAVSDKLQAATDQVKLENQVSNYTIRQGFYYVTSPIDGYVTKLIRSGIGETIKEGEDIVSIMPEKYDLAIEFYVEPIDYPLLKKGGHVRIQFDGWPVIFFSGWPNASFGTFGGDIVAIDNFISPNGKYRVMAIPSNDGKEWPDRLRVGGGAKTFVLLNDVPIWYELWRQINGFPPEYYTVEEAAANEKEKKDEK